MINVLRNEHKKLITLLPSLDPTSDTYMNVLRAINELKYLIEGEKLEGETVQCAPAASLPWEEPIAPMQMPEEKSIIPKEEPIVIKNVDEVLTKDVVRARLQGASEKGVHIQPIIAKFVPDGKPIRFSSVPESDYTALIKELYDAQNK